MEVRVARCGEHQGAGSLSERRSARLADAVVSARAAAEDEAERARCLERRVAELTDDLAKETRIAERLERKNKRLALHVRHLREQIRSIRSSRSWMVLESLRRLRARLLALRRRTQ